MTNVGFCAKFIVSIIAIFEFSAFSVFSQTPPPKKPSFEVASVKSTVPNFGFGLPPRGGPQGNRFTMTAVPLRSLLVYACDLTFDPTLTDNPIIGGPGWLDSDRFDIQAKTDDSITTLSTEQARLMLQSLLEDRFQLKAHLETRDVSVYNLVVAKDGLKMKVSRDQGPYTERGASERGLPTDARGAVPRGMVRMTTDANGRTLSGSSARLASLIIPLQLEVARPIIDKTDDGKLYDFVIRLGPPASDSLSQGTAQTGPQLPVAAEPSRSSVFKALEDVGLRLEYARGPIKVLIIDSVQKPTEN